MKNWKTTLFGSITALGIFFSSNANATLSTIGNLAQAIGVILLGGNAKDHNS